MRPKSRAALPDFFGSAASEVVNRSREAGIRHRVHATNDHLVFELACLG